MQKNKKKTTTTSVRQGLAAELHAPARRRYERRRTMTKGFDDLWQADLVDMQPYSKSNRGMRYILTVIDVYSKYAWAEAIKKKTGAEVVKAFDRIVTSSGREPRFLQTDQGTEFYNTALNKWLRERGIHHYSTFSNVKAAVVERFNRTLKERMWRRFTAEGTRRWTLMLADLLRDYNNTKHRTIGMKPKDVKKDNSLMRTVYDRVKTLDPRLLRNNRFRVGDIVRVSTYKSSPFRKGYEARWGTELFKIVRVHLSNPVTYSLEDLKGETIKGRFYTEELQRTRFPDHYLVERVVRKKGPLRLVKWLGFDSRHNSWVHARDIEGGKPKSP